jgi:hypothetical protein
MSIIGEVAQQLLVDAGLDFVINVEVRNARMLNV